VVATPMLCPIRKEVAMAIPSMKLCTAPPKKNIGHQTRVALAVPLMIMMEGFVPQMNVFARTGYAAFAEENPKQPL